MPAMMTSQGHLRSRYKIFFQIFAWSQIGQNVGRNNVILYAVVVAVETECLRVTKCRWLDTNSK